MASRAWHEMNSIMHEIENNRKAMNDAKVHVMFHESSVLRNMVVSLESAHAALYDRMYDQCEKMMGTFNGVKN